MSTRCHQIDTWRTLTALGLILSCCFGLSGCPQTGACCDADGECSVVTEADCDESGGTYQGDGTTCDPNPCPAPSGLSGTVDVANFSVAKGQTQQVSGDLTIIASGSVDISGALAASGDKGQSITITAEGDVDVSGTLTAGNGSSGGAGGGLTIVSTNGNIVLSEGSSIAAGDGGDGQTTLAARAITITDKGTIVLKTVTGGAGGGGGSVTLRALNGDITIADTAGTIRIGSGGNGAKITVSGEDLLTTDAPETLENSGGESGDLTIEANTFNGQAVGAAGEVDLTGTNFLAGGRGGNGGDVFWGMDEDGNSTWPDATATAKVIARAKGPRMNLQQTLPDLPLTGAHGEDAYFGMPGSGASVSLAGETATEPGVDGQSASAFGGDGGKCKSPFCTHGGSGGSATVRGGDGTRGENPDGDGGSGGGALAFGGFGGFGFVADGPDGSALAIGGEGGKGGGQCPDDVVFQGGRGGEGGFATARGGTGPATALAGNGGDGGDGEESSGEVGIGGSARATGGGTPREVTGDDGLPGATCPPALMVNALVVASSTGSLGIGNAVKLSCIQGATIASEDINCDCRHVHGSILVTGLAGGPFDDTDPEGCGHGCVVQVPEDELDHTCN